jgi:hypothetical protein
MPIGIERRSATRVRYVRWLYDAAGLIKDLVVVRNESDFAMRLRDSWRLAESSKSEQSIH